MNFDPDEIFKMSERLRDVFNRAAAEETGAAKPLFEKLAYKVNGLFDKAMDPSNQEKGQKKAMMDIMFATMDLRATMTQIKAAAQNNPAAAQVLQQVEQELQAEVQSVLPMLGGILPGISKFPGMDFGQRKQSPARDEPKKNDRKPPRPPSDGGSFDL